MKVLVAPAATLIGDGDECEAAEGEIVVVEHCDDCDPTRTQFRGAESGMRSSVGMVVERKDVSLAVLAQIFADDYRRHYVLESEDDWPGIARDLEKEVRAIARVLQPVEPGSLVQRERGTLIIEPVERAA